MLENCMDRVVYLNWLKFQYLYSNITSSNYYLIDKKNAKKLYNDEKNMMKWHQSNPWD